MHAQLEELSLISELEAAGICVRVIEPTVSSYIYEPERKTAHLEPPAHVWWSPARLPPAVELPQNPKVDEREVFICEPEPNTAHLEPPAHVWWSPARVPPAAELAQKPKIDERELYRRRKRTLIVTGAACAPTCSAAHCVPIAIEIQCALRASIISLANAVKDDSAEQSRLVKIAQNLVPKLPQCHFAQRISEPQSIRRVVSIAGSLLYLVGAASSTHVFSALLDCNLRISQSCISKNSRRLCGIETWRRPTKRKKQEGGLFFERNKVICYALFVLAGDVAQWQSMWFAITRPEVRSLASPHKLFFVVACTLVCDCSERHNENFCSLLFSQKFCSRSKQKRQKKRRNKQNARTRV